MPLVSIIIVNWNTRDLLRNCLKSIEQQTDWPHEVIVIDNCSADRSAEMAGIEFPQVQVVANTGNRGFAAANNQGIAISKGQYVLLLNPDTIILDHAIDKMAAWLAEHKDVGCVGCQVLEDANTIQQTCFADPTPLNQIIIEAGGLKLARYLKFLGRPWYCEWDRRSTKDVDVVSGMFMLMPRKAIDEAGELDEAFFVYAEEADLCRRIRALGWRCVFVPIAQILHLDGGSKSTAQIRSRMHVQMHKSHMIYAGKHHGRPAHILLRCFYVMSSLARLAVGRVCGVFAPSPENMARNRLSLAALRFHLCGEEPKS